MEQINNKYIETDIKACINANTYDKYLHKYVYNTIHDLIKHMLMFKIVLTKELTNVFYETFDSYAGRRFIYKYKNDNNVDKELFGKFATVISSNIQTFNVLLYVQIKNLLKDKNYDIIKDILDSNFEIFREAFAIDSTILDICDKKNFEEYEYLITKYSKHANHIKCLINHFPIYMKNKLYKRIVMANVNNIMYIPHQDEKLCKLALRYGHQFLDHIHPQYRTKEVCKKYVYYRGLNLKYSRYQTNKMCNMAVDESPDNFRYVRDKNEEICLKAITRSLENYHLIPNDKITYDICKNIIQQNFCMMDKIPLKFQTTELKNIATNVNPIAQYMCIKECNYNIDQNKFVNNITEIISKYNEISSKKMPVDSTIVSDIKKDESIICNCININTNNRYIKIYTYENYINYKYIDTLDQIHQNNISNMSKITKDMINRKMAKINFKELYEQNKTIIIKRDDDPYDCNTYITFARSFKDVNNNAYVALFNLNDRYAEITNIDDINNDDQYAINFELFDFEHYVDYFERIGEI